MADVRVALETIVAVRFHHALVNDELHVTAWTSEGLQRVAAAAGDVVVLREIALESVAQSRTALFPLFFGRDSFLRFAPEILGPAIGFEQEQLYIFYCVRMARVIGDVTITASGANPDAIRVMRSPLICRINPGHRVASCSAEFVRAGPVHYMSCQSHEHDT